MPEPTIPCMLVRKQDTQVAWDRIKSARIHNASTCAARQLVIVIDDLANEECLPGEVGVVGSALGASRHEAKPVLEIWTDGGDDRGRA